MNGARRKQFRAALASLVIFGATTGALAPTASHAAAPPPLSVYGNLPSVEDVAISPSGDHIAIVGMVEGVRRLVVLDQQRKPLLALPLEDAKIRGIYWAGDRQVLVYKTDTKGLIGYTADKIELATMVVVPLNGDKLWSVFDGYELVTGGVRGYYGIQQRDGKYYGYFSAITYERDFRGNRLNNFAPVLYEVDLQTGRPREIGPRFNGGSRDWVMAPAGKIGATLDYTSKTGAWMLRNGAGEKIAEGVNPLGRVDLLSLGVTPETVLLGEQRKGDEVRWFDVPLAGGERKEFLADANVHNLFFDKNTRQFIGYQDEGDAPAYHFSDAYRQKVVNALIKAFPNLYVHLGGWNDSFDRFVVMTDGVGDAQTWWTVDIKTGQASELGSSYLVNAADVGPMSMVHYKATDGMDIPAVLTLPPGRPAKNLPVVIFPHGGPAARDYPGFDWWAQALASRGYAVLQPNFRGSTGYGAAFEEAGHGQWGRKMQSDLSDGLAYLASQGIVDPRRACIMGASYGGYAALAGVTLQHGIYRCAVAVAGVSDVAKMVATDVAATGYDKTTKRVFEEEWGTRQELRPVSPISFAAQADAPILLIHGKDDTVVPYDQSNDMAVALRKAGKPVELVTLAGEDHHLSRGATRLAMLEAAVRFIEANNPPDPVP